MRRWLVRYHEPQAREAYELHFWEYIDGSIFDLVVADYSTTGRHIFGSHILSAAISWRNVPNIALSLT
jgi:hypothetical protein